METDDSRWMKLALDLGARGLGQVWPNPAVGCVIVKDGRLLGRGWTQKGGRPHAETVALAQAGEHAHGATAYVTLEPCAHHGQTPPCASALVNAGIARVICPLEDPDSRVAGKGFEMLRQAGVIVDIGLMEADARVAQQGFLLTRTQNRPMVTLKLATSLDGRIATQSGESRWITGPEARAQVHLMRATHDAVLIGRGTAKADDPMLDIRGLGLAAENPVRVVLDSRLSLSAESRLVTSAKDIPLWICHSKEANESAALLKLGPMGAVTFIETKASASGLDIVDLLHKLAENGLTRVLCEGGGQLAASLIAEKLVDQLEVFHAGLALGASGTPALAALPFQALQDFPRFKLAKLRQLGPDTWASYTP